MPCLALALGLGVAALGVTPAMAQQNQQQWFVPPGQDGSQRPAQVQQRPPQAQQQGQRPAQRPAGPLPAGQPPPAAVIGIVDVPEIQRESTAFNQVREEIERRRQKLNDDLQREQTGWRDAQQQLANLRATLPPEQLRQRERDLQDRITESQRIFRERSRGIEQVAQQALIEIEQALGQVIRQVAASRSVNLVVPRPLVILSDPGFDLTTEVAQQFNRQLRSVTIPPETAAVGADAPAAQPAAQPAPQRPAQAQPAQRR
ncbi:MAG: OmpH family outer membrane protein [Acetobacteraceae bacterium]|nr:OmpH family outer membrane protein [Acetobacteraceae bacterium]